MDHSIYRLSLDMHCDSSGVTLHAKRRDTAREIHITLTDGGVPYSLSPTCFAMLTARTPEGLLEPLECTVAGSTILCPITAALTATAGEVACELRVYEQPESGDAMLLTGPRFTLEVSQPVQDGTEEEDLLQPQQNALDSLVGKGMAVVAAAEATVEALREAQENGEFNGTDGIDGKDGYTPIKGVDYFTEAEQQALLKPLEIRAAEDFSATAIVCTARGDGSITVTDGAAYPLQGLTLYGMGEGGQSLHLFIPEQSTSATVLRQPASVTAPVGTQVQFSIVPGGSGVSFKWEYSTNGGTGWYSSSFPGNNTSEMTVPVTAARDGFLYRCRVAAADGSEVASKPGKLTVGDRLAYAPAVWNTDGAVLTVTLPHPLAGALSDTGNYADTKGQLWQSAVLDLASGRFTAQDGTEEALEACLSGLRCRKGSFTLLNDLGAGMVLSYVADPKTYIDQYFRKEEL